MEVSKLRNYFIELTKFSTKVTYNVRALCRCGIRIPSARNRRLTFDKDKYLKPMFGDVGQELNRITNVHCYSVCPTCTKPNVLVAQLRYSHDVNTRKSRMIFVVYYTCREKKNTPKNYFSIFS